MKKLILVPTILVTAFLAVAFLMPGTAAGALRAVPGLNAVVTSAVSAAGGSGLVSAISGSRLTQGSGQSAQASSQSNGDADVKAGSRVHSVATSAHPNCGRFGNGFHGGKHNFACPNRPFPPPANH